MSERKVPKIRFPGFEEPWKNEFISSMIELSEEKVTSDSELPVLTSSKTDGIQYQVDHFGRAQEHDVDGYNVLRRGYCTYRNRSDGTDFTFNINNLCDEGIISKFYPVFNTKDGNDLYFLTLLLNNEPKTIKTIAYTAKGTGQKVLSITDLKNMEIIVPESSEQEKIGAFFRLIDDQISSQQNELDKWKELKKGMLQKMFPKEGKSVPEIRFPGFDGEWSHCVLGDTAEIKTGPFGTQLSSNEYVHQGVPVINVKNIGIGHIIDSDLDYISEEKASSLHEHIILAGDIVFGRKGAIDRHAIINIQQSGWVQGSDCIRVRFNDTVVPSYFNDVRVIRPVMA